MRHRSGFFGLCLALLSGLTCASAFADGSPSIQLVVPTIDYPAAGVTDTRAFGINDLGSLTFQITIGADVYVGTQIGGQFSTPSQPTGTVGSAAPEAINNFNVIVGSFTDAVTTHGFLLKNGRYTAFDVNVPNVAFTFGIGINDVGVLSGYYRAPSITSPDQAFRQIGNKEIDLNVDSAVGSQAGGTNDLLQTTGHFSETDPMLNEATCNCKGVVWDASGHPTTVNVNNAVSIIPIGINIPGWVCGRFYDKQSNVHGFVYNLYRRTALTYDHPNATATTLNGINDAGYIAGRYTDSLGTLHGFIAKIVGE